MPKLVESLRDKDAKVRIASSMALWAIARQKDGVPVLCEVLKNADALHRQSAAKGLHAICQEAKAAQIGFVDKPGHRKIHRQPIPLGGGVAIFWAFVLPLLGAVLAARLADPASPPHTAAPLR